MGEQPTARSVFDDHSPAWEPAAQAFGQRLRDRRGDRTQADIAAAAGLSRVYLSDLERGRRRRPGRGTLERLAAALGADLEELGIPPSLFVNSHASGAVNAAPGGTAVRSLDDPAQEPVDASRWPGTPPWGGRASGRADAQASGRASAHVRAEAGAGSGAVPPGAGGPTLRVYRSGTQGDPRDVEEAPMPLGLEWVPVGKEGLVGFRGFTIINRGDDLRGWWVHDGDQCVVNPDRPARLGGLVGVEIHDDPAHLGLRVYELGAAGDPEWRGQLPQDVDGLGTDPTRKVLVARPQEGPPRVLPSRDFTVLGPVVGLMSWRSPDEARAKARRLGADRVERHYARAGGAPATPPVVEG